MLYNVSLMLSAWLADIFIMQGWSEESPTQLKRFQEIKAIKLLEKTSWVSRGWKANFDLTEVLLADFTKEVLAEEKDKSIMELLSALQNVPGSKIHRSCPLKVKWEPEGKACVLLFPNGWILWNPVPHIRIVQHSLAWQWDYPTMCEGDYICDWGEGGYSTEQTIIFASARCKCTTLTFSCSSTNYTSFQRSYFGIIVLWTRKIFQ